MNFYFCDPCDKSFTGIRPYEDHLASEKHKKVMIPGINDSKTPAPKPITTSTGFAEIDPFIVTKDGISYTCNCCKIRLNSVGQARSHALGNKHIKRKRDMEFSSGDSVMDSPKDLPTQIMDITDSDFVFTFRDIKIEGVLKEIKIFGVNDTIVF